ncbi:ESX secretion-associated protein EspG [Nocardia inohanensis]|uniref:ESX secretion-associated protein EspG n=1 Tax=Nocardia inohanensis TaxID=209246 RepID=UPI00082E8BDD|nr:ESX secretion-associated protein EspG [Nocardia inohanensis]
MKWEFTDLEFRVLTNRYVEGWMPTPLMYTCRTDDSAEYDRQLAETDELLRDRLGPSVATLFDTIHRPEVIIVSHTWCDDDMTNPEKRIRVHGALRDRRACMITQKPGETIYHSGGFTITECDPEELPRLIVAELPAAEPGRGPVVPIVTEQPPREPRYGSRSMAFDSFDDTVEATSLAFLSRRADWTGTIRVLQSRSKYGPRGVMETTMLWRDVADDGRYLIELGEPELKAVGIGSDRLTRRIEERVEKVRRHMEARGEDEY